MTLLQLNSKYEECNAFHNTFSKPLNTASTISTSSIPLNNNSLSRVGYFYHNTLSDYSDSDSEDDESDFNLNSHRYLDSNIQNDDENIDLFFYDKILDDTFKHPPTNNKFNHQNHLYMNRSISETHPNTNNDLSYLVNKYSFSLPTSKEFLQKTNENKLIDQNRSSDESEEDDLSTACLKENHQTCTCSILPISPVLTLQKLSISPVYYRNGLFINFTDTTLTIEKKKKNFFLNFFNIKKSFTNYTFTVTLLNSFIPIYENDAPCSFVCKKRYTEFEIFYNEMVKTFTHIKKEEWPEFPKKGNFKNRFNNNILEDRKFKFSRLFNFISLDKILFNSPLLLDFFGVLHGIDCENN
ncbi:hypothetical protein HDU92_007442 [Lobulomyces angularis]|nr:hypothetical protein HDU92_007442 [Lobulomyces angularis]